MALFTGRVPKARWGWGGVSGRNREGEVNALKIPHFIIFLFYFFFLISSNMFIETFFILIWYQEIFYPKSKKWSD